MFGFFIFYQFITMITKKTITKFDDDKNLWISIDEKTLYLFTDWASRKVLNEKLNKKTWRHWWEWIRVVYIWWDFKIRWEDISDYKSYNQATNQDMELKAAIDWLNILYENDLTDTFKKIVVVSDSSYVIDYRNVALFHRSKNWWKSRYWVPLVHKEQRKDFFKINQNFRKKWISVTWKWVKWHKENYFNKQADHSAVQWTISKNKIERWQRRWVRMPFLKKIKFDENIDINWEKWILIHITNYVNLWKWWKKYNCEIVSLNHEFFRYITYILTNQNISSQYIYKVDFANDNSHKIKQIINQYTKKEIKKQLIESWVSEDTFYKK
jgi:ribonuclease HI